MIMLAANPMELIVLKGFCFVAFTASLNHYLNCVCAAKTVYEALPTLIIVYEYTSTLEALPEDGAVPPCHRVVTPAVAPSTCTVVL